MAGAVSVHWDVGVYDFGVALSLPRNPGSQPADPRQGGVSKSLQAAAQQYGGGVLLVLDEDCIDEPETLLDTLQHAKRRYLDHGASPQQQQHEYQV